MSSHNPFRHNAASSTSIPTSPSPNASTFATPSVSHNTTGNSTTTVSSAPLNTTAAAGPSSSRRNDEVASSESISQGSDPLTEELPPAYTPAADSRQGEHTVEYGPTRPFQNPHTPTRPPPPQHPLSSQSTGWSTVQNHFIHSPPPPSQPQSLWQQITGNLADQLSGLSTGSSSNHHGPYPNSQSPGYASSSSPPQSNWAPPPGPPPNTGPPPLPPRNEPSGTSSNSEFTRDFYAAGAGPLGENTPNGSGAQRYPPPPGPPPPGHSPTAPPPSASQTSHQASNDDGRPTKTPVPGHPLLNQGKLLVYPSGYECDKCHNTGYKQNDPSHSCRKCWSKYAKPFVGAITYGSFSSVSAGNGKTFQRPLPLLRPPHASNSSHHSGYPGASYTQNLGPAQSPYHPPGPPPPVPNIQTMPGGWSPYGSQPPPGSVVYAPGDPRLGGRQCWRCDGDGLVGGFFFEEQCPLCSGIGRIYR